MYFGAKKCPQNILEIGVLSYLTLAFILTVYHQLVQDRQWNDCHVIAHDLNIHHGPEEKKNHLYLSTQRDLMQLQNISPLADQIIDFNGKTIDRLAIDIYEEAAKNLRKQFSEPLESMSIPIDGFIEELKRQLDPVVAEFTAQSKLWKDAIDAYKSTKETEFLAACNALHGHITKLPTQLRDTEDALRAHYRGNGVYKPIGVIAELDFDQKMMAELIEKYAREFRLQFDNDSKLHTESQQKATEFAKRSHFRKFLRPKKIYTQTYNKFLLEAERAVKNKLPQLVGATKWNDCYAELSNFVDQLNEYGTDSFEMIYRR